jgi:hypothetical protein
MKNASAPSESSVDDCSGLFIVGGPGDVGRGWAWCLTDDGLSNRVVHYIDGYGWLGHQTHVLEVIHPNEAEQFGLDLPGYVGRRNRLAYSLLRAKYVENPEAFCREILAPVLNHALASKRRRRVGAGIG